MLIIWLQGIWLPLHGYDFSQTPLWAGLYLVPLTVGFLVSAPLSGVLSDRVGAKAFTVGGALLTAATFFVLLFVPVNFTYWEFALIIAFNGFGSGLFFSPNRAEMMNSVPADRRGTAGGMIATVQNSAFVLSIGIFFSLMVVGLSSKLPGALSSGLTAQGVPAAAATPISHLPPIGVLFASFLGYNPMQQLLGPLLGHLSAAHAAYVTGRQFFPQLITAPFKSGLEVAFAFAIAASLIAAIASLLTGRRPWPPSPPESLGADLAAVTVEGGDEPELVGIYTHSRPPEVPDAIGVRGEKGDGGLAGVGALLGMGLELLARRGKPESLGQRIKWAIPANDALDLKQTLPKETVEEMAVAIENGVQLRESLTSFYSDLQRIYAIMGPPPSRGRREGGQ
jgi:Major Facilitator Superfamily